jgi:hypothetical protein
MPTSRAPDFWRVQGEAAGAAARASSARPAFVAAASDLPECDLSRRATVRGVLPIVVERRVVVPTLPSPRSCDLAIRGSAELVADMDYKIAIRMLRTRDHERTIFGASFLALPMVRYVIKSSRFRSISCACNFTAPRWCEPRVKYEDPLDASTHGRRACGLRALAAAAIAAPGVYGAAKPETPRIVARSFRPFDGDSGERWKRINTPLPGAQAWLQLRECGPAAGSCRKASRMALASFHVHEHLNPEPYIVELW